MLYTMKIFGGLSSSYAGASTACVSTIYNAVVKTTSSFHTSREKVAIT